MMQSHTNGIDRGGDGGGPEREPLFQVGQSILVQNVASPVLSFSLSFSQRNEVSSPIVSLFLLSTISLSLSSRGGTKQ